MSLSAPMTIEPLAQCDEPSVHLRRLDRQAGVKTWLAAMWGIRSGQSSPTCQLAPDGLWLYRLWGKRPSPAPTSGG